MAAGHLIAVLDLALLGHVDANHLVDARGQIVIIIAGEAGNADDLAHLTVRHLHGGIADLAGLLTENGAQQALLRGQLGLTLRGDLTHQDVAGADVGTDADDAALVQVAQDVLRDVWDLAGDFLSAQLGIASINLVLFDVDGGQDVLFHDALVEDDGVLVVMAFPRHEGNQQVAAEGHLTIVGTRAIGQNLAGLYALAHGNQRGLVVVGALVGALELTQDVGIALALIIHDGDDISGDVFDHTGLRGDNNVASVVRSALLHTGTHQRSLGAHQRHGLLLHVRTHQGTVSIVVLQERNHGRTHGNHLARGDVNVVHTGGIGKPDISVLQADLNTLAGEVALCVLLDLGLSNSEAVLFIGGEVLHLVGDLAVHNLAVRGLNEAESIHAGVGRQRTNEANVRALRGLNRAHTAVVRSVNVSHLNASALTRQAAWAQRGQAALVGQAGQRVVVVHELGQLRGTEKLADSSRDRAHVNQGGRSDGLRILGGHALAHNALHAGQAHTDLVLDELTDGAQAAITKVVDVIRVQGDHLTVWRLHLALAYVQADQVLEGDGNVFLGQGHQTIVVAAETQLAVDFVAADLCQVVTLCTEEGVIQQGLCQLAGRLLAWALLAVNLQQCLIGVRYTVRLQGGHHELGEAEAILDLLFAPAQCLKQHGYRLAALAVNAHANGVALVDVEL